MSGIRQQVHKSKIHARVPDPGPGRHVWVCVAAYRLTDPAALLRADVEILFDTENLVTLEGPVCWKCQHTWNPVEDALPCDGSV